MDRIAIRLVIKGRVQGVGYRWWARSEARRLGLAGWVRNRRDGSVELLAAGFATAVAELAALCWRGPALAEVAGVDRFEVDDDGLVSFEEWPTA
ncbi:MAG TPA: acylphosphatase [Caulobacteraceae bacterium]|nr:acylphosphatase [Caulobacteraceae bacterium]